MEGGAPQSTEFGGAPRSTKFWIRFRCWSMQYTIKHNKKLLLRQVFSKANPLKLKFGWPTASNGWGINPDQAIKGGRKDGADHHYFIYARTGKHLRYVPPLLGWSGPSHITRWQVKDFGGNEKKMRKEMKAKRKAMGRKGKGNERKWKGSERKIKEIWENEKKRKEHVKEIQSK